MAGVGEHVGDAADLHQRNDPAFRFALLRREVIEDRRIERFLALRAR